MATDQFQRSTSPDEEARYDLYAAVGAALSQWELAETGFALIFATLLRGDQFVVQEAYGQIVGFSARRGMVNAAATAALRAFPDLKTKYDDLVRELEPLASSRNKIAHGVVVKYSDGEGQGKWRLMPPIYARRQFLGFGSANPFKPKYVLDVHEIVAYAAAFGEIATKLILFDQELREKLNRS